MFTKSGSQAHKLGFLFEAEASFCVWNKIVPERCLLGLELIDNDNDNDNDNPNNKRAQQCRISGTDRVYAMDEFEIHIARGVSVKAALGEIDLLVLRVHRPSLMRFQEYYKNKATKPAALVCNEPVEVLAVIEVKRNIDDLGHAYRNKQQMLAFLTGDVEHYDQAQYRVKTMYPDGVFAQSPRVVAHTESTSNLHYPLNTWSFRLFQRQPPTSAPTEQTSLSEQHSVGDFLDGMYYIAKRPGLGLRLRGVPSKVINPLMHRISTDRCFGWNDVYMQSIGAWLDERKESIDAAQMINHHITSGYGENVIFLDQWWRIGDDDDKN
jgi:hypothetical protein